MCVFAAIPVAVQYIALAVSAAATVAGASEQIKGDRAAAKYGDQVAAVNEKLAENRAADALQQGSVLEAQKRAETRQMIGKQIAGFGAQNVVESGTALDVLGDTAAIGQTDIQRIRYNAARQAWGFGMDAYNTKVNNDLNQFKSKVDQQGTILSTVGKLGSMFGSAAASGMFSDGGTTMTAVQANSVANGGNY